MTRRVHYAWIVAAVAFLALLGAAGMRSAPSVLMVPLQEEFGWGRAAVSFAVSVNLVLYGLIAPFAAALTERFGMRRVVTFGLVLIALGSGLTIFMTATWQLVMLWGVFVGTGTGTMAMVFAATVANRWFVKRRGLVTGVLTAAGATGQLVFLPVLASVASNTGWRTASLIVAGSTLLVAPLILIFLREHPSDVGLLPYGGTAAVPSSPVRLSALGTLRSAARTRTFWLLAGGFAICGATTNGLIGTHFLPAAHDHGMGATTAAGLLALIGIFDVIGTVGSGWLTDRVDPRVLLGVYYGLRGLSLLVLPLVLTSAVQPSLLIFIIVYGLDWIATVPPTIALCREHFGTAGTVVAGWVFTSHQIGAAIAATAAGAARDAFGTYGATWILTGILAVIAAGLSVSIRSLPRTPAAASVPAAAPEPAAV